MTKPGTLWIAVDVDLLDASGNRHDLDDVQIVAYLRCLAWCRRQRTDGLIPVRTARQLLNGQRDALVAAGLIGVGERYVNVLDWLKWNDAAAAVDRRREMGRARKRRQRERDSALKSKNEEQVLETDTGKDAGLTRLVTRDMPPPSGQGPVGRWLT